MSGRISAAMVEAQKYLRKGMTAYEAAKRSGITQSAISQSKKCREIIKEVKRKQAALMPAYREKEDGDV